MQPTRTSIDERGLVAVCTYRVASGNEPQFEELLQRHLPTLRRLGLISDLPTQTLRLAEPGSDYVEVFEWIGADAAARAAEVPEVIEIWEPMAALCEPRDGSPAMEFPLHHRVEVGP